MNFHLDNLEDEILPLLEEIVYFDPTPWDPLCQLRNWHSHLPKHPQGCYTYEVRHQKMTLTTDDLQDLLTLIDFHDDYEEVKDVWGIDLEPLRDKVSDLLTQTNNVEYNCQNSAV